MKYAVIVPDGAADHPVAEHGNRTPLETARTPHLDRMAREGKLGLVHTIPAGMPPGSDVANLSVLGYDPKKYYTGRGPLEAASLGITLAPNEVAFRCNLVTTDGDTLADYAAGEIRSREAHVLIDLLNERLGSAQLEFYAGVSFRNLMVFRGEERMEPKCTPPHDIIGQSFPSHLPTGPGSELLRRSMERSRGLLAEHEINAVRLDLGENPANMIWLWGNGRGPTMPSFREVYGKSAAVISAVDLINGIAACIGMDRIDVPGATASLDTDYAAKGRAAIQALKHHDLVLVHIEAPDTAGHAGQFIEKVRAIEQIDKYIIGPILAHLEQHRPFRMLVLPDHPTPLATRTHAAEPVPFAIYGEGIESIREASFTEREALEADLKIEHGHELIGYLLKEALAGP